MEREAADAASARSTATSLATQASVQAGELSPRGDHPTLILEVGKLARAVRRLLLGPAARAGDDDDGEVVRRPNLALVGVDVVGLAAGDTSAVDEMAQLLRGELDRLMSLPEMIANQNVGGPPRLFVFVVADVTESGVALAVQAAHGALLELVAGRYAPLFQGYREGIAANLHVNPLLVLPAPGEPWPADVQALMGRLEAMQRASDTPPPVNNIFVVGETSGGYMLERAEIAQLMATFLELCLSGELSRSTAFERLLDRAADPYGTFVCATVEFDTREAVRYGGRKTAIEMMQWLRRTSEERTRVAERAGEVEELFDVSRYAELVPLEKGDAALSRAIDSQCPDFSSAFRDVALTEDGESILSHYDERWRDDNRSSIEAAARELGLFRIDEIIEEVEVNGAALLQEERGRLDAFVADKLSRPSEGNVADVALSLRHLRKRLGAEEQRLGDKATAELSRGPDVKRFDEAYKRFDRAVMEKPRRARLLLWGLCAWAVATVGLALPLRHVPDVLGLDKASLLRTALEPHWSWLTAAVLCGVIVAALLLMRLYSTTAAIRVFVGHRGQRGELAQILEDLSRGADGSLQAYYGSRFRRACDIWVHRTLLSVIKHVEDQLERIGEVMTVLELQVNEAQRLQAAARARAAAQSAADERGDEHWHDDGEGRSGQRYATLRRRLVAAEVLDQLAVDRRKPRDLEDVVKRYFREHEPFSAFAAAPSELRAGAGAELPFADLDALISRCARYYDRIHAQSALLEHDLEAGARRALSRFCGDFGARLDFHLDFSGRLFRDADDLDRALAAVCVCGAPVRDIVAESLRERDGGRWEVLPTEEVGNRVHLLKLVSGIAPEAIRWHIGQQPRDEIVAQPSAPARSTGASEPAVRLEVVPARGSEDARAARATEGEGDGASAGESADERGDGGEGGER